MKSVNDLLLDRQLSHEIDLRRYSSHVIYRMMAVLNRSDARLLAEVAEVLERLSPEQFTVARLERMLNEVRAINKVAYEQVEKELAKEMAAFVKEEAAWQVQSLSKVVPVEIATVESAQVYAAAYAQPFRISKDGAISLSDMLAGSSENRVKAIKNAISLGYLEGQTTDQIIRSIRGTKPMAYKDGLLDKSRRSIAMMTQTAVSHYSNFARNKVMQENGDILKGWTFTATLDSKTSLTCASLSGKVFKIGEGPMPPRHYNCRSTMTPLTKSWKELGIDMPEIGKGATRASIDGQVPAETTYSDWLKSKPAAYQDEVLGRTRGKLFRDGGMTIDKFTDRKGHTLTLDELRKRNKEAFEKADL